MGVFIFFCNPSRCVFFFVNYCPRVPHWGAISAFRRYSCVSLVCPIRILVSIVSSFRFGIVSFSCPTFGWMYLSLLFCCPSHSFCYFAFMYKFILFFLSVYGIFMFVGVRFIASLASLSASEFLLMPTWLGINAKTIFLLQFSWWWYISIMSWMNGWFLFPFSRLLSWTWSHWRLSIFFRLTPWLVPVPKGKEQC